MDRPKLDKSLKCKYCGKIGYDATSEDRHTIFAKWTICKQAFDQTPDNATKSKLRKYLKIFRRQQDDRTKRHFEKQMKALKDNNMGTNPITRSYTPASSRK